VKESEIERKRQREKERQGWVGERENKGKRENK
jgi:hypothetical protein